ncbi:MAG TPA: helix-turn-helix transcriptional regulator [Mycobacterium sp.]|nr:helix-turn-helix transcriptional regulator [Mycobacterium sp.]
MDPLRAQLAADMNTARKRRRMGWGDVAQAAGMTPTHLLRIRKGKTGITEDAAYGIEQALGWPEGEVERRLTPPPEDDHEPLTAEQEKLLDVYYREYLPKYGQDEALGRLQRDVDEINARIERKERPAG